MLVVQIGDKHFLFPVEGSLGQRGTPKEEERISHHFKDSKIVFFSRAKMPYAPIKKKLKRLGINHMTILFLVNGKVVRDNCRREVLITTENALSREGSMPKKPLLGVDLPYFATNNNNNNNNNVLPDITTNDTSSDFGWQPKKRKMDDVVREQLRTLIEEGGGGQEMMSEEKMTDFVNTFSDEQLALISDLLLTPLVSQRKKRQEDYQHIWNDLLK